MKVKNRWNVTKTRTDRREGWNSDVHMYHTSSAEVAYYRHCHSNLYSDLVSFVERYHNKKSFWNALGIQKTFGKGRLSRNLIFLARILTSTLTANKVRFFSLIISIHSFCHLFCLMNMSNQSFQSEIIWTDICRFYI